MNGLHNAKQRERTAAGRQEADKQRVNTDKKKRSDKRDEDKDKEAQMRWSQQQAEGGSENVLEGRPVKARDQA